MDRFWNKVEKTDSCWFWKGAKFPSGYGVFTFEGKSWRAHRFSYHMNKGKIPYKKFVCHACDNPLCVNPDHLWIGTHTDNIRDAVQKHRMPHGKYSFHYGVSFNLKNNRWRAYAKRDGKQVHIGSFSTESEALQARKLWMVKDPKFYTPTTRLKGIKYMSRRPVMP